MTTPTQERRDPDEQRLLERIYHNSEQADKYQAELENAAWTEPQEKVNELARKVGFYTQKAEAAGADLDNLRDERRFADAQ